MQNFMDYNCRTHYDACRILGIPVQAGRDVWKSAYREICRKFHPDVFTQEYVKTCGYSEEQVIQCENYFKLAANAYEFLEKEAASGPALIPNTVPSQQTNQRTDRPRPSKIIGSQSAYQSDHASYLKNQEEFRRRKLREHKEKQEELKAAAQEIRRKEEEDKILDQIRWLRVSEIIRKVILQDKLEKEISKKQE